MKGRVKNPILDVFINNLLMGYKYNLKDLHKKQ